MPRKEKPAPAIPDWIKAYTDGLKANVAAAVDATDWDRTSPIERAFVQQLIGDIDAMAKRWAFDVAEIEERSRETFARWYRKEGSR